MTMAINFAYLSWIFCITDIVNFDFKKSDGKNSVLGLEIPNFQPPKGTEILKSRGFQRFLTAYG
jgi:hypothetical protein